jgi:hypothetical protein
MRRILTGRIRKGLVFGAALLWAAGGSTVALADGTEFLAAPPGIPSGPGTGVSVGGVGLDNGAATMNVTVPAGASVVQTLVYWSGEYRTSDDDSLTIDGVPVTGTLIGGPTNFFSDVLFTTYRADVTGVVAVVPGLNSYLVDDLNYDVANSGVGMVVIFDEGTAPSEIEIRDGQDLAFVNFANPLDSTVKQTYSFAPSSLDRDAIVSMLFGSVGGADRPSALEFTVGGVTTTRVNALGSFEGDFWDVFFQTVTIPAGATSLDVQAFSRSDGTSNLPASFNWIAAALSVPGPEADVACRMTGGGANENGSWDGLLAKARDSERNFYTFGGQHGAPTANQPQPYGEWTHVQHKGPAGQFTFHAGTSSAPPGTEVDRVSCSDPGFCRQARPAPAKQLNAVGVGSFRNIKKATADTAGVVPGETLHCYEVFFGDYGEPGRSGRQSAPGNCVADGFEGRVGECSCPDYYRIAIHETEDCSSDVIYSMADYIRRGNIQLHPPIK